MSFSVYDPADATGERSPKTINIVVPMAGISGPDDATRPYPLLLTEINQKPLVELALAPLKDLKCKKRFVFVVTEPHCREYALDSVLRFALQDADDAECEIVKLKQVPQGAACTVLMAIEQIDSASPLVVMNCDHVIDYDLDIVLKDFQQRGLDAGVICFDSIHPRWSSVIVDAEGALLEASEKRPISRDAIAGFYYFRRGSDFMASVMSMIRKGASKDGQYYIAPAMNEMIIRGTRTGMHRIPNQCYHNFSSVEELSDYAARLRRAA